MFNIIKSEFCNMTSSFGLISVMARMPYFHPQVMTLDTPLLQLKYCATQSFSFANGDLRTALAIINRSIVIDDY